MKNIIFTFLLISLSTLIHNPCSAQIRILYEEQKIGLALDFAGKNKVNLQEVLNYYSKNVTDSLKLKAAKFLIANMTGHFSYAGYMKKGLDELVSLIADTNRNMTWSFNSTKKLDALWDSVMHASRLTNPPEYYAFDNKEITADLLIENIEFAFQVWDYPWSKHLKFDQFCEYVLPYRFYNEPIESWRPAYMKEFSWLIDSLKKKGCTDPVEACFFVNTHLKKIFRFTKKMNDYPAALGPVNLMIGKSGKCLDQAGIANYVMRAIGIPVILEQIPRWADRSLGHEFSSILTKDGTFVSFLGAELPPYKNEIRNVAPKIYRTFYSIQDDRELIEEVSLGEVAPLFDRFQQDVSKEHIPVKDLQIELAVGVSVPEETIYLCVFDNKNWAPFASSKTKDSKTVIFNDVGLGAVYLPVVYREQFKPVSAPVLLNKYKSIRYIKSDPNKKEAIVLNRKYPLGQRQREWLKWARGGKFQGSNTEDFSDAKDLWKTEYINMAMNRKVITSESFRYIRYLFPDSCHGSLAEIEIYADSLKKTLKGKPISSSKIHPEHLKVAFDERLDNYIHTDNRDDYDGEWIGIDLGSKQRISGLGISPRNDTNGIMEGMNYELFYWDGRWVSLGKGELNSQLQLVFTNAPINALFILKNHTQGEEERIFTYEQGKQQFW